MDYKRHIKTVLLISLIVLSFVLVVRLWSVGNYFGSGFKDFIGKTSDRLKAPIVRIFKEFGRDNATHNFEYVLSPKRIVVNSSDKRSILNSPDKDFEKFYEVSTKIIGQVKSGEVKRKSVESVSEEILEKYRKEV